MKVIFLDFDGVLVTAKSLRRASGEAAEADPLCVTELNRLTDITGAKLVISSTWRLWRSFSDLQRLLKHWSVKGECIGLTPNLCKIQGGVYFNKCRGEEIAGWLASQDMKEIQRFTILDDDRDMGALLPFLIQTKMESGLTTAHVHKAVAMLK
jgi:hypothetical protein